MTIINKIEQQWLEYVKETGKTPNYLYLGCDDAAELDVAQGMVVFKYKDMWIVIVERNRHVAAGDRYSVEG